MISTYAWRVALACGLLVGGTSLSTADTWPTRAVTAVSPFTAGNANDLVARIVLDQVSRQTGQPFVIENRPGAGGAIGVSTVASMLRVTSLKYLKCSHDALFCSS